MPLPAVVLAATLQAACAPSDGLQYVCGPVASEDIARVPDSPWLVASGLNVGAPAHLYLVDHRSKAATPLFPDGRPLAVDAAWREHCPSPPRLDAISMDGLNVRSEGGRVTLVAANHGDRHAIEIFRIDVQPKPVATWVGCVPMPEGTLANAVVPLADGGLIATSFHDPRDPDAWRRMADGQATGSVWEWHATSGWRRLPARVSGANGIALSADERTLYVSAWSGRRLLILDRASNTGRELLLDFLPDNLKRADDGTLLVAGQRADVAAIGACRGPRCPQPWVVARIDPRSGAITMLLERQGSVGIDYACTALDVDGTLYLTARGDARLAWLPMP